MARGPSPPLISLSRSTTRPGRSISAFLIRRRARPRPSGPAEGRSFRNTACPHEPLHRPRLALFPARPTPATSTSSVRPSRAGARAWASSTWRCLLRPRPIGARCDASRSLVKISSLPESPQSSGYAFIRECLPSRLQRAFRRRYYRRGSAFTPISRRRSRLPIARPSGAPPRSRTIWQSLYRTPSCDLRNPRGSFVKARIDAIVYRRRLARPSRRRLHRRLR